MNRSLSLFVILIFVILIVSVGARAAPISKYCQKLEILAKGNKLSQYHCGIIRASQKQKKIALLFTGDRFAPDYEKIRKILRDLNIKASFFFTGDLLRTKKVLPIIKSIYRDGHFIGPHSNRHLVLVDKHGKTQIARDVFFADLQANLEELKTAGIKPENIKYWIPPYETYNEEIARWSAEAGLKLINYTEGTYSNTDYTGDLDPHFRSNDEIEKSVLQYVSQHRDGLNGFLLLFHLGSGNERSKPFSQNLGHLLVKLSKQGYFFQRIDALLASSFSD